jgi:hypothetical protein
MTQVRACCLYQEFPYFGSLEKHRPTLSNSVETAKCAGMSKTEKLPRSGFVQHEVGFRKDVL